MLRAMTFRHLDLFSGIGGFALAVRWLEGQTIGFCEIEDYPQRVLRKNFPGVPIHDDIRTLTGDIVSGWGGCDLITGGFPCQPFSTAGQRRGAEDHRHLWPEMFRVIDEVRPRYVLGENVANLSTMALEEACTDMEGIGYEVRPVVIPAISVGAIHQRSRVWIMAYHAGERLSGPGEHVKPIHPAEEEDGQAIESLHGHQGLAGPDESGVGRTVHGVPDDMDRLTGLGNAIVPQVAYEILRVMLSEEC